MPTTVMIRGRYVSTNRPLIIVVSAIVTGIVAGVNLGLGLNYTCFTSSYNWQNYCSYQKNAYIIAGSLFLASSVCLFISALALHLRIKKIQRTGVVVVQQDVATPPPYIQPLPPAAYEYPVVIPPQQPAPPPAGFADPHQAAPPLTPKTLEEYDQQPPPYSP